MDLKRQTNYVLINSQDTEALEYSIKVAEALIQKDKELKVFVLPDMQTEKNVTIGGLARFERGKIGFVNKKDKPDNEALPYLINQTKYGLFILSSEELELDNFNDFRTDLFKRKSIDVLMHKNNLLLNSIERTMLKDAKKELKEDGTLPINFSFRIFPAPINFLDKEMLKKMVDMYGVVDAIGIILTQHIANKKNTMLPYLFFARGKNPIVHMDVENELNEILNTFGFDDNAKENLTKTILCKTYEPEETKSQQPTANSQEQETTDAEKEKVVIEDDIKEEESNEKKIDKEVNNLIDTLFKKVEAGEIELTKLSNPVFLDEFAQPFYDKVKDLCTMEHFALQIKANVMKFIKA